MLTIMLLRNFVPFHSNKEWSKNKEANEWSKKIILKTLVENPICRAISESVALQDSENEYIQHPIILGALHFVDKTKSRLGKDEKCEGSMVPRK